MSIGSFDQVKKVWVDDAPTVDLTNMAFADSTLQGLDAWTVDGGSFFPSAAFSQNPEAWNGVPVVYASDHPDMSLFDTDPEAAMHTVAGRVVGKIANARIESGKLKADVMINDHETDCLNMQKNGRLGLSTAFRAMKNGAVVVGGIKPQNVLVFPLLGGARPRDAAARISNKRA